MRQVSKRFSISFAKLFMCVFCLLISTSSFVAAQTTTFHVPLDFALTVDWSPDGTKLAVGGGAQVCDSENDESHAVYILDAASGEVLHVLLRHTCQVNTVAWSPDSKLLVSGSDDTFAFVWDAITGEMVSTVQAPKDFMARSGQTWSPDGKEIADYYAGGKKAFIWDAQTGEVLQTFEFPSLVTSVAWPHSGNQLAIGELNAIHILDSDTGEPQSVLSGRFGSITSLDWSDDDSYLAAGSVDNDVRIWDLAAEKIAKTFSGHTSYPVLAWWSPDGSKLVSAGEDNTARIWDVATGDQLAIFSSLRAISGAAWGSDGQLAYVDAGGIIQIVSPDKVANATPTVIPTVTS